MRLSYFSFALQRAWPTRGLTRHWSEPTRRFTQHSEFTLVSASLVAQFGSLGVADHMSAFAPLFQGTCPRCKVLVRVPESLPLETLSRAVALRRTGRSLDAAKAIATPPTPAFGPAKALVFHITTKFGHCHRCDSPLTERISECPHCRSLCLDYDAQLQPSVT